MSRLISIKKKQPDFDVNVIVRLEHWHTKSVVHVEAVRVDESDCNWRIVEGGNYRPELDHAWNVTHWMPLPEPPKENE